jgi:hypothetical protein
MVDAISCCSRRSLPLEVCGQTEPLRPRCELVEAAGQLVQPGIHDGPLGLRVGRDLMQPLSQARLHLVGAILERLERVVALPLQGRAQTGQTLLDA